MARETTGPASYIVTRLGTADPETGQASFDAIDDVVVVIAGDNGQDYLLVAENPPSPEAVLPALRVVGHGLHGGTLYLDRPLDFNGDGVADNTLYADEINRKPTHSVAVAQNALGNWQITATPLNGTVGTQDDSPISSGLPTGCHTQTAETLMQDAVDRAAAFIPNLAPHDMMIAAAASTKTRALTAQGTPATTPETTAMTVTEQTVSVFEPYPQSDMRGLNVTAETIRTQAHNTDYVTARLTITADMVPNSTPLSLIFDTPDTAPSEPSTPAPTQRDNWWKRLWSKG